MCWNFVSFCWVTYFFLIAFRFLTIVQILAEEAVPVDQIDGSAAQQELSAAQQELSRASGDKEKAEAQIAVEVAEALVAASKL